MQAVILAGGLGTRLRQISRDLPKPMVPVLGKPYLFHQIRMLRTRGFGCFHFLLSYQSDAVVSFLNDYRRLDGSGLSISWSVEPQPMGTAGALKYGMDMLEDSFVLLNGDSYLEMDYNDLWKVYKEHAQKAVMAVYGGDETDAIKNVVVGSDLVSGFGAAGSGYIHAGAVAMSRCVLDMVPDGKVCSLERDVYPSLAESGGIRAYITCNRFYDIGTPERYVEFERALGSGVIGGNV